jgi:hypothetical protein
MSSDTAPDLDALEAAVKAMTPGPWTRHEYTTHVVDSTQEAGWIDIRASVDGCDVAIIEVSDAEIDYVNSIGIVALRNAAPWLIARARESATKDARIAALTAALAESEGANILNRNALKHARAVCEEIVDYCFAANQSVCDDHEPIRKEMFREIRELARKGAAEKWESRELNMRDERIAALEQGLRGLLHRHDTRTVDGDTVARLRSLLGTEGA